MTDNTTANLRTKAAILSLAMLIAAAGCDSDSTTLTHDELEKIAITQQRIDMIEAAGGLTLVIGGETITSDEIIKWPVELGEASSSALAQLKPYAQANDYDKFAELARPQLTEIIIRRISNVLIYQIVKNKRGDTLDENLDKAADSELRKFIMENGGDDAKADEKLKEMGIDRERFKELRKRWILVSDYIGTQIPQDMPITYRQMMAKYNEIKDRQFKLEARIQFSLIDIQPAMLKAADPNITDADAAAATLADSLVRKLKAGEDFATLAQEHSNGPRKLFGGQWKPISPDSLVTPYDILVTRAEKMKPGEISNPITTLGHVFIMRLDSFQKGGYKPFVEVQDQVKAAVVDDERTRITENIFAQIRSQAELGVKKSFVDFCLHKIYDLSNAPEKPAEKTSDEKTPDAKAASKPAARTKP